MSSNSSSSTSSASGKDPIDPCVTRIGTGVRVSDVEGAASVEVGAKEVPEDLAGMASQAGGGDAAAVLADGFVAFSVEDAPIHCGRVILPDA